MSDDIDLIERLAAWYKAQDRLAAMAGRLEGWADSVGHHAQDLIVPKWARPVFTSKPAVGIVEVQKPAQAAMFDMPVVPKKSRAVPKRKKSLAAIYRDAQARNAAKAT